MVDSPVFVGFGRFLWLPLSNFTFGRAPTPVSNSTQELKRRDNGQQRIYADWELEQLEIAAEPLEQMKTNIRQLMAKTPPEIFEKVIENDR